MPFVSAATACCDASELRLVAEVKSGKIAASLACAATRRQLLEYRLAYDVDGVMLVDMAAGRVHEVRFPRLDDAIALAEVD
jgi:hypothetical protein